MPLLTVTESFAVFRNGHPEVYNAGRLVRDDDPVVKGREQHFESADSVVARTTVESATAAPGERRSRGKARKTTARKAAAKQAASTPAKPEAQTPVEPAAPETPADPPAGDAGAADKL